jgi:hypothetical protein
VCQLFCSSSEARFLSSSSVFCLWSHPDMPLACDCTFGDVSSRYCLVEAGLLQLLRSTHSVWMPFIESNISCSASLSLSAVLFSSPDVLWLILPWRVLHSSYFACENLCCVCFSPVSTAQGIRYGSAKGRRMIPRILNLMAMDPDELTIQKAVRTGMWNVPVWIWLPYLNQLQASLVRPEALLAKDLLVMIAGAFPQVTQG